MAYIEGNFTYASSIDSGITNLYAKYCYKDEYGLGLPVYPLAHPFATDADSISTVTMRRFADRHVIAVAFGLRGGNGASGAKDSSGREIYDIFDGLAAIRSVLGEVAGPKTGTHGWSAGGGTVLGCLCKIPESFQTYSDMFGISDYGWDVTDGWFWQTASHRSELEAQVGDREADGGPYRSRNMIESVSARMTYGGSLFIYHDSADGDVPVTQSRNLVQELRQSGITNVYYNESAPGDAIRWLHGLPDQVPDLIFAEERAIQQLALTDVWSMPAKMALPVMGWAKTNSFDIFLGATTDPKFAEGGGTQHAAIVTYDTLAGSYYIEPLTAAPMYVEIHQSDRWVVQQINGCEEVNVNSLPTATIAAASDLEGCVVDLAADAGVVLGGSDVASWTSTATGAMVFASGTNRPAFLNAFEGAEAIEFDASNSERLDGPNILDPSEDFTMAFVIRPGAIDAVPFAFGSTVLNSNYVLFRHINGTYAIISGINSAGVIEDFGWPLSSVEAWHSIFIRQSGGTLSIQVDDSAYGFGTAAGGTFITDCSIIGALRQQLGRTLFWTGHLRSIAIYDRALLNQELYQLRQYWRNKWPGIP